MQSVRDTNGKLIHRSVKRERNGWGVNVWFGGATGPATEIRRYVYRTREQARNADISHDIGSHGRIA